MTVLIAAMMDAVCIGVVGWDPAGLLFCVLPMSPGSLNDENAQRWE